MIIFATHYTDLTADRLVLRNGKYVLPRKNENSSFKEKEIDVETYLDDALVKKNLSQYS